MKRLQFTPRPVHIAGAFVVLLVVVVLLTVLIAGGGRRDQTSGRDAKQPEQPGEEGVAGAPVSGELEVSELEMPNEARRLKTWSWEPSRTPRSHWGKAEADRFWYDPEKIGTGYLEEENDRLVEELLEDVP